MYHGRDDTDQALYENDSCSLYPQVGFEQRRGTMGTADVSTLPFKVSDRRESESTEHR
jgi:hypothetical protein